jgi:hypothetical protein
MRYEGEIGIRWSWAELSAVRESIELTPSFAGRDEVRAALRRRPRRGNRREIKLDVVLAQHLAANLVALDIYTAVAKSKLLGALQEEERHGDQTDAAAAA